jgi:alpha-D-xyloside xylohydrolase
MKRFTTALAFFAALSFSSFAQTTNQRVVLESPGETIVLEPYAQNILHVTISKKSAAAEAAPGYGIVGKPDAAGWTAKLSDTEDVYSSSSMVVTVNRPHPHPEAKPGNLPDTAKYFSGSAPWARIAFRTPQGKTLLNMLGWEMADYNHKDGTAQLALDRRPQDGPSNLRLASRRTLLRPRTKSGRLPRSSRPSRLLLARLQRPRRPQLLRSLRRHQQGLRPAVG